MESVRQERKRRPAPRCHAPAWPGHPVRRGFLIPSLPSRSTGSPGQAGRWQRIM